MSDRASSRLVVRIGDNLGVVLSLERKGAAGDQLLLVVRWCWWNIGVTDRCVPSELNSAEEASRVWDERGADAHRIMGGRRRVRPIHKRDAQGCASCKMQLAIHSSKAQTRRYVTSVSLVLPRRCFTSAQRHGGAGSAARAAPHRMPSEAKRELQPNAGVAQQVKPERPSPPKRQRRAPSPNHNVLVKASSPARKNEPLAPPSDDSSDLETAQAPLPKRDQRVQQRL